MSDSVSSYQSEQSPLSAVDIVRQFKHLRALVIGDAMLDTYLEGTASRLCSEGPVPVVSKTAEYRIPGGAANTAANLSALGAKVDFLAAVGQDLPATLLRAALSERGVSDRWLVEDEASATLHKLRVLADGQYVVRFDEGDQHISDRCQQKIVERLEHLYPLCDLVLVSDYRYGVVSDGLLARLQQLIEAQPKVVVVDSKTLRRFRSLRATVVTPNYLEARLLVDGSAPAGPPELTDVERLARSLLSDLATEQVAITLAELGVFLLDRQGHATHIPAHPVAQANDVGAGDSFAAALALSLAAGSDSEEAVRIAIDAAGIAVARRWTSIVQQQELLQRVSVRTYTSLAGAYANDRQLALAQLLKQIDEARSQGRTIVFTNGVFDILHAGHVQFLRQARMLGDLLVVGVNSDESARQLKGSGRPINSARDRMALVSALDVVDHVVSFDEATPVELIRLLRPHIHVKGGDYADEALPEAEAVRECGGRVVILPLAGSVSTSSVIERIIALAAREEIVEPVQGDQ